MTMTGEQIYDLYLTYNYVEDTAKALLRDLRAEGYRPYGPDELSKYELFMQKEIKNGDGVTLYFINVEVYDFYKAYTPEQRALSSSSYILFSPEARFNTASVNQSDTDELREATICISLIDNPSSAKSIDNFFAKAYANLGCIPYE